MKMSHTVRVFRKRFLLFFTMIITFSFSAAIPVFASATTWNFSVPADYILKTSATTEVANGFGSLVEGFSPTLGISAANGLHGVLFDADGDGDLDIYTASADGDGPKFSLD